jgi:FKBP-type peptidyl-prolyl cis-trans isomerase SlyD
MTIAKDRVVSIDYTLTNASGQLLDSSAETGPLAYLHGNDNIIAGLEKVLEGKTEGDSIKVTIPAADAYGERIEELVQNVPLDRFQGAGVVEVDMQFEAQTAEGSRMVRVIKVANGMATVDANHPFAGMDLNFDVKVTDVREASAEELEHGHPHVEHSGCGCGGNCGGDGEADCDCGNDGDAPGCGCGGCH